MFNRPSQPRARGHARAQILRARALCVVAVLVAVWASAPPSAHATAYTAPGGKVLVGVSGGRSVDGYVRASGKRPAMFQFFVAWGDRFRYAYRRAAQARAGLMVHLSTYNGPGTHERITPRAIALGRGDGYLLSLGRAFAAHGQPVYLRLFGEMNNAANPYSAFNHDGSSRGSAHGPFWFRQAWRRVYLVVKGGRVATINARLRALGLPPVRHTRASPARSMRCVAGGLLMRRSERAVVQLPRPKLAVQWAPMTAGSPDIAANRPGRYWPGGAYVDWVGTDFYSRFPSFSDLDRFYSTKRYGRKPFVFGEWGMWGRDTPSFVPRFFAWVATHRRVRMLAYYQGNRTTSEFRLYRYPKASRAIRKALRSPLYTGRPRTTPAGSLSPMMCPTVSEVSRVTGHPERYGVLESDR